jgi:uncharacterized protein
MRNERFEWDDAKAQLNLRKHGVDFEDACLAIDDPNALIEADDEPDEERWQTIGLSFDQILFVVWTERHGNIIRIISAREASSEEEDRYFRQAHLEG